LRSCDVCDVMCDVVGLCLRLLNKVYTHCCCFVVAMPSLKREAERRGKRRPIPDRRQIARHVPTVRRKKRTSLLVAAARYSGFIGSGESRNTAIILIVSFKIL
ncbi:hypothetical protein T4C_13194, partial [Trichinella pseudospiralis]